MHYVIVRHNPYPSGDWNKWLWKSMEGDYVIRQGTAETRESAYRKAHGEEEPKSTVSFGD